jgi:8-oxo-dGTP diphosphatase
MISVAAAYIVRNGSVLLCQRSGVVPLPLLWEFPGGKIEQDESVEEGLSREIKEELGVDCLVGENIAETTYQYDHGLFHIKLFSVRLLAAADHVFCLTAHSRCAWIPLPELQQFSLNNAIVPSNRYFITLFSDLPYY